jgi:hypothetical protein
LLAEKASERKGKGERQKEKGFAKSLPKRLGSKPSQKGSVQSQPKSRAKRAPFKDKMKQKSKLTSDGKIAK